MFEWWSGANKFGVFNANVLLLINPTDLVLSQIVVIWSVAVIQLCKT
jgi:hypothetical protein